MREKIDVFEYAGIIAKAVRKGVLLNTQGDKFNSMVIGWGHLGTVWSLPTFIVYVREHRYTKSQLDKTGEFSVSIPLSAPKPAIHRICGQLSGWDIDKAAEAALTLEPAEVIHTPAVREYPLTLECRILHAQRQDIAQLPEALRERMYPQDVPWTDPMSNCDPHTEYIGQIVSAYVLR